MVVNLMAQAMYFVGHQIPLFLLVFGLIYIGLGFAFKSLTNGLSIPIGVLLITASIAWFTMTGGSILAMPLDVMEIIGVGILLIVVGKIFAG